MNWWRERQIDGFMGRFITNWYVWFAGLIGTPDIFVFNWPLLWPWDGTSHFLVSWYLWLHNFGHWKSKRDCAKAIDSQGYTKTLETLRKGQGKYFLPYFGRQVSNSLYTKIGVIIAGTFPYCLTVGRCSHSYTSSTSKWLPLLWQMLFFQLLT